MKVLFAGLGSIGQRHLRNLKTLVKNSLEILAYRETSHNHVIIDGKMSEVDSLKEYYGFSQVTTLEEGLAYKPEIVVITNPSSKHLDIAIPAAETGAHLFIEKPLSNSLEKIPQLEGIVNKNRNIVMIGFQTRFHPCYQIARNIINEGEYGRVISALFEWGTYLPQHHSYEDYAISYAARENLGGGVTLGLIHELDIINSFWGHPDKLFAVGGKLSRLNIDVDDTVSILMKYSENNISGPVSLFLSYAQTKEKRSFKIQFERATLFCDMINKLIDVYGEYGERKDSYSFPNHKHNDLFICEMEEFLDSVREKKQPTIDLNEGIASLKLALRIKEEINGQYS